MTLQLQSWQFLYTLVLRAEKRYLVGKNCIKQFEL